MKRWVIDRHGHDSLRIDEGPASSPGAGDVLVRVLAVALNARDLMITVVDRRYAFDELPAVLDHLDSSALGKIVIDMPAVRN